VLDK